MANAWILEKDLNVDERTKRWLTYNGSTTSAMKTLSKNQLVIDVIQQNWECPNEEEQALLGSRQDETVFAREIFMLGQEERWMFCRTLFPKKTLTGEDNAFTKLNTTSLGSLIYKSGHWKRSPFEFLRLTSEHPLAKQTDNIGHWARRSFFENGQKYILVQEVFLPDLLSHEPVS